MIAMEWWKELFDEEYLRIYSGHDKEKATPEVENIESILELRKGTKILDLCCGYRRHSILLAEKGYEVTGLDFSKKFIKRVTDENNFKVLKETNRCLKRGGKFLIDTVNREWIIRNFKSRDWSEVGNVEFVLEEKSYE